MNNMIENLRNNITGYKFSDIKNAVADFQINKENIDTAKELIEILKSDKRKNVISLGVKYEKSLEKYNKEVERVRLLYEFDRQRVKPGEYLAGVDEVGRGPLAGPIVAAAVVLDLNALENIILEINDSKKISAHKREELAEIIKRNAVDYSIALCDHNEIDEKGIGVCNNLVFLNSVKSLKKAKPSVVLSDGYLVRNLDIMNEAVIKGDTKSASIACASIIAKVYRDNIMKEYDEKYPHYDFIDNVGYGTSKHVDAIKKYGPCKIHRLSFLRNILK